MSHSFLVSFIVNLSLEVISLATYWQLGSWSHAQKPTIEGIETLKIHPFDFNLWFHLLPPLRFTTLHKLQRKVHVGLAGVLVLWSKKIETYGQTPRLHAIPILAVIIYWLVVYLMCTYPSEKYESQLSWLFPIYGKIKNCSKPPASISSLLNINTPAL